MTRRMPANPPPARRARRPWCPWRAGAFLAVLAAGLACDQQAVHEVAEKGVDQPDTPLKHELAATIDSGFKQLRGIAIDAADRIYLAGDGGIRVLDAAGSLVGTWETSAPPQCVAVDAKGEVLVGLETRVERYSPDGKLIRSWGEKGKGQGKLSIVTGIEARNGHVYVADAGRRRILCFASDGDLVQEFGEPTESTKYVGIVCRSPFLDCAVDANGIVHVTNPGMLRVERHSRDAKLLGFWGEQGEGPEQFCSCCNPTNIALMPGGRVVTSEKVQPRVKVYDAHGKMLAYIGEEYFSEGAKGLDLAVDSRGRIHVVDPGTGKVLVFELHE